MSPLEINIELKKIDKKNCDRAIIEESLASRKTAHELLQESRNTDALERVISSLRTLRDFSDFDNVEFRALLMGLLFDLAEIHFALKDYKQSEKDNGIAALKKKYQGYVTEDGEEKGGASTLISRAKSEVSVPKRKGSPKTDPDTGELVWKVDEDRFYTDPKTGKTVERRQKSTQMAETKDPYKLSSGTPQEEAYASYASQMKSLANQARKEILSTGKITYSASAKETYQTEVASLTSKLNIALKNAPRERQAQVMANSVVAAKKQDNPSMTTEEIKKAGQQALSAARATVGAKRTPIVITDREWQAIQAGAISENKLTQIINHADIDVLRSYATPRATTTLSTAKINKISSMNASGYTTAEIAESLGVSTATVRKYLS